MKKQALKIMKERSAMIEEIVEVLEILDVDIESKFNINTKTQTKTVEKIVEVPVEVEVTKEVVKEVVIENKEEIERLKQIIAEREATIVKLKETIKTLKARQNIVVENTNIVSEVINNENIANLNSNNKSMLEDRLEITVDNNHAIYGYYLREEGDNIKKTPFTCGKKTCSPIVYGKDMMKYSEVIGQLLLERGLVKNHKTNVSIHNIPLNIKGKEIEMMVYKDKTGALVGSVEQRCAFSKHPSCKFPLVTEMKTFIKNGVHQITNEDGSKSPLIGYKSIKTHDTYKHAIASALAKFEKENIKTLEELSSSVDSSNTAESMFDDAFGSSSTPVVENNTASSTPKDVEALEAADFAKRAAELGIIL